MTAMPTEPAQSPNTPAKPVQAKPAPLRSFGRTWLAILLLAVTGIAVQTRDVFNDRSISNIISLVMACTAALVLLSLAYRWLQPKSSVLIAGLVTLAIAALPITLVRLRGFSGEMVPSLEWRFRSSAKLQSSVAELSEAAEVAKTPFPQFLGTNRDAVIESREFSVPQGNEEEMWRIAVGEGWAGFAIQTQFCVTLEQREKQECVTCYRLADGALIWIHEDTARHENPLGGIGPRSTPTIAGDYVYTQGATGIVYCLKLATGEVVWKQQLLELGGWAQPEAESSISWGRAGSALIVDQLCVIPFGRPLAGDPTKESLAGRSLIAFDIATGEIKWTAGEDQISYASPVLMTLGGTKQIVSVNEATVTGHDIADGRVLWTLDWPGQSNGGANCASALPLGNDSILIAKGYGIGCGVFTISRAGDNWSVNEKWTSNRVLKTKFTHACIDGNIAYALSDGTLECVDITDGKRLWVQGRASRYGHGQIIRAGDCLVVQTEAGEVAFVAASPEAYKVLSTLNALNSKTWNVPSIAGRYLAVRNDTEAVMYRLPGR